MSVYNGYEYFRARLLCMMFGWQWSHECLSEHFV